MSSSRVQHRTLHRHAGGLRDRDCLAHDVRGPGRAAPEPRRRETSYARDLLSAEYRRPRRPPADRRVCNCVPQPRLAGVGVPAGRCSSAAPCARARDTATQVSASTFAGAISGVDCRRLPSPSRPGCALKLVRRAVASVSSPGAWPDPIRPGERVAASALPEVSATTATPPEPGKHRCTPGTAFARVASNDLTCARARPAPRDMRRRQSRDHHVDAELRGAGDLRPRDRARPVACR